MKNAARKPEHLHDALASQPENLKLQDLALPDRPCRQKEDFLKEASKETIPANAPFSLQPIR